MRRAFCALVFVAGCATGVVRDHVAAETYYLGAFAYTAAESCNGGFELVLGDRPSAVIETQPAIYESSWTLRACDKESSFTLDCSMRKGDSMLCGAHEWPMPVVPNDYPTARSLDAVAKLAPRCPPERSCVAAHRCAEDGMTIRRPKQIVGNDFTTYEVSRCGITLAVNVRCTSDAPYSCVTTTTR